MNRLREAQSRIVRLEESVSQVAGSLRECHVRVNHCEASRQSLSNQMRTQGWFHDLSEQKSSDEIHAMLDGAPRPRRAAPKRRVVRARVPLGELEPWFAQLRQEAQANGLDNDAIHQRIHRFWQITRAEKPIVEALLSRDQISSDMSPKMQ